MYACTFSRNSYATFQCFFCCCICRRFAYTQQHTTTHTSCYTYVHACHMQHAACHNHKNVCTHTHTHTHIRVHVCTFLPILFYVFVALTYSPYHMRHFVILLRLLWCTLITCVLVCLYVCTHTSALSYRLPLLLLAYIRVLMNA